MTATDIRLRSPTSSPPHCATAHLCDRYHRGSEGREPDRLGVAAGFAHPGPAAQRISGANDTSAAPRRQRRLRDVVDSGRPDDDPRRQQHHRLDHPHLLGHSSIHSGSASPAFAQSRRPDRVRGIPRLLQRRIKKSKNRSPMIRVGRMRCSTHLIPRQLGVGLANGERPHTPIIGQTGGLRAFFSPARTRWLSAAALQMNSMESASVLQARRVG